MVVFCHLDCVVVVFYGAQEGDRQDEIAMNLLFFPRRPFVKVFLFPVDKVDACYASNMKYLECVPDSTDLELRAHVTYCKQEIERVCGKTPNAEGVVKYTGGGFVVQGKGGSRGYPGLHRYIEQFHQSRLSEREKKKIGGGSSLKRGKKVDTELQKFCLMYIAGFTSEQMAEAVAKMDRWTIAIVKHLYKRKLILLETQLCIANEDLGFATAIDGLAFNRENCTIELVEFKTGSERKFRRQFQSQRYVQNMPRGMKVKHNGHVHSQLQVYLMFMTLTKAYKLKLNSKPSLIRVLPDGSVVTRRFSGWISTKKKREEIYEHMLKMQSKRKMKGTKQPKK